MARDASDRSADPHRLRDTAAFVSLWLALIFLFSAARSAQTCAMGDPQLPENCRMLEIGGFHYTENVTVVLLCVSMLTLTLTIALQLGSAGEIRRPACGAGETDDCLRSSRHRISAAKEEREQAIALMRRASVLLDDAGDSLATHHLEHAISVVSVD